MSQRTNQHSWPDSGQIYVISMEFLLVNRRRLSPPNATSGSERGEAAVFAGYCILKILASRKQWAINIPTIITLSQERLVHRYIITFKYIHGLVDHKYIHGLVDHNFNFLRNSDIHNYNTRRRNDFHLPLAKINYGKQRLFYQWAKEWNILDESLKEINFLLFKQNIKSYIL